MKNSQNIPAVGCNNSPGQNGKIITVLFISSTPHHVRIQGRDPLGGGSRDKEAGQAPHGHGYWCPLSEVGQRQQHPVAYHGRLACGVERLENLGSITMESGKNR